MSSAGEGARDPEEVLAEILAGEREVTEPERDALLEELGMSVDEFAELSALSTALDYDAVRADVSDADALDVDVSATLARASGLGGGEARPAAGAEDAAELSDHAAGSADAPPRRGWRWTLLPLLVAAATLVAVVALRDRADEPGPGPGPRDTLDTDPASSTEALLEGATLTLPSSVPTRGTLRLTLEQARTTGSDTEWQDVWKRRLSDARTVEVPASALAEIDAEAALQVHVVLVGGSVVFDARFPVSRR